MNWIIENMATIIVSAIVLGVLSLALYKIIKDKKSGKTSCGCSCSGCAMKEMCHKEK
ncbi:MAG: FeoB-associated Cys-rich membrane protein [Clostridia bacterium]|nr:FeoB-associated Cys-rich membrane protein [Clostridia bacterium]